MLLPKRATIEPRSYPLADHLVVVRLGHAPLLIGNGVQGSSKLANSVQVLHHMGMGDNQDARTAESAEQVPATASGEEIQDAQEKLRKALAQVQLTPEQTRDDIAPVESRDRDLMEDVPPHHN